MKPVIPDYEWITYGERVRSRLFLIMNGSHTGSGSVSTRFNSAEVILDTVWSKISHYFQRAMPWDDGVYINNVKPMLIAKVGKNSETAGWVYKTIELSEGSLLREDNITWEPEKICAVHISMINLMAVYGELPLSEDNISYFKDKYSVDLYEEILYLSKTRLFMISEDALKPINKMTLVLSLEDGSGYVASERDRLDKWCKNNNVSGSITNIIQF